jgi:hypothetical protein
MGVAVSLTTRVYVAVGVDDSAGSGVKVLVGMIAKPGVNVGEGGTTLPAGSVLAEAIELVKLDRIVMARIKNTTHTIIARPASVYI